jgi:hypothetical protein
MISILWKNVFLPPEIFNRLKHNEIQILQEDVAFGRADSGVPHSSFAGFGTERFAGQY